MTDPAEYHSCTSTWPFVRLQVRQCPACGTWWIAYPASVTAPVGGWRPASRVQVWWAQKRGRVFREAGGE